MHRTVKILKESSIVDSIISMDSDALGDFYRLKIQAMVGNSMSGSMPHLNSRDMHIMYLRGLNLLSGGIMRHITDR